MWSLTVTQPDAEDAVKLVVKRCTHAETSETPQAHKILVKGPVFLQEGHMLMSEEPRWAVGRLTFCCNMKPTYILHDGAASVINRDQQQSSGIAAVGQTYLVNRP